MFHARAGAFDRLLHAREVSAEDLAPMRRIDDLRLEHPFAGARMLRDLLRCEGFRAGSRSKVGRLLGERSLNDLAYIGR